ncbi:uncharacterized protein LOC129611203 isoform X2 [Condylostylus longicornis]|uniref:uncharacterized protein LOC129611203 isoform X2 n=1 Tax=Condylostylus longicornis TaxID=2530218 RepID=UPI00244DC7BB|nr:uncharacterized protein LOC129611203 isoform X2 [Condylostylus longicornis]
MEAIELLREFNGLGCGDEKKCAIAYRLFVNLKEVCKYENIERIYDANFDEIYFSVPVGNKWEIYLPISSFDTIDLLKIEKLQETFCNDDTKRNL